MAATEAARFRLLPFALAIAAFVALILAAPFLGEIRRAILARFPGQFGLILGAIVAVVIAAAVVTALARIRDRRLPRYLAVAGAVALGAWYMWRFRTGDPQVDAVERFHFIEYGIVTLLFYRAWRPAGGWSAFILPALSGLIVGTVEEWFQWFIPARVGDVGDVFLNGVAITCGLIFSAALIPPATFAASMSRAAFARVGALAAVWIIVFAGFFQSVHLGYFVSGDHWRFRSSFTAPALEAHAADRAARWQGTFLPRPKRLSAEDQYQTEGHNHVARRNLAWEAGDARSAWYENLILEQYFAPVLDTPSYVSANGHRWAPAHRSDAEQRAGPAGGEIFESQANPSALHVWPRGLYWTVVLIAAAALMAPWTIARTVARARESAAPESRVHL